jgi:osmotically-inducible protein OsmY
MEVTKMTDKQIEQEVSAALESEAYPAEIGVAVEEGVVTLYGEVDSYDQMHRAEQTAKEVYGVRAVADGLQVNPRVEHLLRDQQIAMEAVWALETRNNVVPVDQIKLTVRDGWVTLEGTVDREFQREAAEDAVCRHPGVAGIINLIEVRQTVTADEVQHAIEASLRRNAELDAHRIGVDVDESRVILSGSVRSWREREEAAEAAGGLPGITEVDNRIVVVA